MDTSTDTGPGNRKRGHPYLHFIVVAVVASINEYTNFGIMRIHNGFGQTLDSSKRVLLR